MEDEYVISTFIFRRPPKIPKRFAEFENSIFLAVEAANEPNNRTRHSIIRSRKTRREIEIGNVFDTYRYLRFFVTEKGPIFLHLNSIKLTHVPAGNRYPRISLKPLQAVPTLKTGKYPPFRGNQNSSYLRGEKKK